MIKNCIREIRKKKRLTQAELAQKLGISQGAIQKLETGERGLDIEWMKKIANALGVEPWMLLPKDMQPNISQNELDIIKLMRLIKTPAPQAESETKENKAG